MQGRVGHNERYESPPRRFNLGPARPRWILLGAAALAAAALLEGCSAARPPEAISLLGRPLVAPPMDSKTARERRQALAEAEARYRRDPRNEQNIIWYGRRLAYLYQYHAAIRVYSLGLEVHPDSYRLLRHRGHRYITVRRLDDAVADLERAAVLIRDVADEVEPDGLPNDLNIPTSTSHTNIYYHLGLAHYLQGDFGLAGSAFAACVGYATNEDMQCAARYWLYLSLFRAGRPDQAAAVLDPITTDMEIIENFAYHELLLMFKGELAPDAVMHSASSPGPVGRSVDDATRAYGIGAWKLINGQRDEAFAMFIRVTEATAWPAFGHIAAEAEIARVRR